MFFLEHSRSNIMDGSYAEKFRKKVKTAAESGKKKKKTESGEELSGEETDEDVS
jgi:hypothetical protein